MVHCNLSEGEIANEIKKGTDLLEKVLHKRKLIGEIKHTDAVHLRSAYLHLNKLKEILDERYLEYLSVYIQVMNPLELFNQSITKENKKEAMRFVENYIFCSYPDFIGLRNSKIIEKGILGKLFPTPEEYKKFAEDSVLTKDIPDILGKDLILE